MKPNEIGRSAQEVCDKYNALLAENEKLRAVYEAVNAAIQDEHEQGHDLDDLTPLWADVEQALAAVEQSEGLHSHEVPSEAAETLDAALRDSVTVLDESECERLGYHVCGPKRGTDQ